LARPPLTSHCRPLLLVLTSSLLTASPNMMLTSLFRSVDIDDCYIFRSPPARQVAVQAGQCSVTSAFHLSLCQVSARLLQLTLPSCNSASDLAPLSVTSPTQLHTISLTNEIWEPALNAK
jgi:hypothetical protein